MSKISPQGHFMKRLHGRRCAGASAGCPGEGVEAGQECAQGRGRAEGNADVDPRQEAGRGGGREEAGGPTEGLSSSVKEAVRPPEACGSCGRDAPASELPRRRLRRRTWQLRPATFNGYKVVFIPFSGGRPSGKAEDSLRDLWPGCKTGALKVLIEA
jgi:hypothetical protein